jgi:response regulator of citrate/malate metabolism
VSDHEDYVRKPPKDRIDVAFALLMDALRKEAMRVGVIDFVAKPFLVGQSLEALKP